MVPAWDQYWTEEKEEVWFGTSLGPVLEEKEEVWFGTSLGPVLEEREDGSCTSVVPAVLVSRPKDTGRINVKIAARNPLHHSRFTNFNLIIGR